MCTNEPKECQLVSEGWSNYPKSSYPHNHSVSWLWLRNVSWSPLVPQLSPPSTCLVHILPLSPPSHYFSLIPTVFSCCHVLTTPYQHTVVFAFHSLSNPKSPLFHSVPFSLVTLTKSLSIPTRCVLGYPKPLTTNCKLSALGIDRYSLPDAAGFLTDIRSRMSTAK